MTATLNPAKTIAFSFLGVIAFGTLLLMFPNASAEAPLSWLDAFFMATSAVCVTGLSVVNIGTELTRFGQLIILALMQAGGLGIMTFSVFFMLVARRSVTLTSRYAVGFQPHRGDKRNLLAVLVAVFLMTISFETLGAALLYIRLQEIHAAPYALYSSIFHAVSAFCNAGFSLYEDSLMHFQKEIYLPSVIMILIVLGGLGFMLVDELRVWMFKRMHGERMRLSLHTRICLVTSAVLIVLGALVVWLFERQNLLLGLKMHEQIINAFFLSVTSRTAGLNTIHTASLTNATLFFIVFYMFIGGCPSSTAGGIKVSTFAVLAALVRNHMRGKVTASIFRRNVARENVGRAVAVFASALVLISIATLLYQVTEHIGISHTASKGGFLDLFFEATSAFGTVGLSTGVTPVLSAPGKLLTIFLMFVGRIGPLTLGLAFWARKRGPSYEYAEEEVVIG
ncbi:MAG: hypothetical protein COV74_08655 [Candidatus Omnitrophica bacterium CG11_big_fil_rev_8_21_14_0_20_45_26]|uniref:Trk family potassium uptake protein n=1 Tax=Candidatus Abzuiibacterium crystallinum TaxID=1974748 RepID=A0A2H0LMG5_9BACT|nr:MAG: hypothetical protein COV74_08655 [Candidatus Omnitrophica bacterium CG11_big_fil_rev_8_21_14_0_20_45_26]PIW63731.1 MAG: hypothetical protein COW12_09540 [Candidatus Omnitrophica bacterium CG12_big_fil_rev_8_21_14_0_65_45_16]